MSRSKDPTHSDLAAMRELLEDTIDVLQGHGIKTQVRARATWQVTDRLRGTSVDPMNKYEQASLRALMAWSANEQKAPPETVKAVTEVRFGVDDVEQLQRKDYEDVIRFLIDLRIDELKN